MNKTLGLVLLGILFAFGIILIYDSALVLLVRTILGKRAFFGFDFKEFAIGITTWVAACAGFWHWMQAKGLGYRLLGATLIGIFLPLFFALEIRQPFWFTSNTEVREVGSQDAYRSMRKRYLQWDDNSSRRSDEPAQNPYSVDAVLAVAQHQALHQAKGLQTVSPKPVPEKIYDVSDACGDSRQADPASMALVEQAAGTGYEFKFKEPVESRLRQAIALDRGNWLAYDRLGRWYLLVKKQPKRAVSLYQEALAVRPGCPNVHFDLAGVLSGLKQYNSAIEHLQQAIALTDEVPASYHYNLGNAYLKSLKAEAAVSAYETALQLDPNHKSAQRNLTRAHIDLRNIDRLLELQGGNAENLRRLGVTFSRMKEPKHAVLFYTAALELEPQADTYYNLALDLALLKRFSESRKAADQALAIHSSHSGAQSVIRLLDAQ